jgi:hypothetical protein
MTIQPLSLSTATTLQTKPATTYVELALKIGAALLITFAATLVLVHAEAYFARSLIVPDMMQSAFD